MRPVGTAITMVISTDTTPASSEAWAPRSCATARHGHVVGASQCASDGPCGPRSSLSQWGWDRQYRGQTRTRTKTYDAEPKSALLCERSFLQARLALAGVPVASRPPAVMLVTASLVPWVEQDVGDGRRGVLI